MKYMGSKSWQLQNGLGAQLGRVANSTDIFVDLFAGSGVVSWFAAEKMGLRVTAVDLQRFAVAISGAIIDRDRPVNAARLITQWIEPVRRKLRASQGVAYSQSELRKTLTNAAVKRIRRRAAENSDVFCRSYGGHYFSIEQAVAIGALRRTLPDRRPNQTLCLAALIMAASRCSASPGHTAQPFQPTPSALPHIDAIWHRDLLSEVEGILVSLSPRCAKLRGTSIHGDALTVARGLDGRELVFVDPPYSAAQYSRFYHVLEAIAVGGYRVVEGAGRAPLIELRERSTFSCVSTAKDSLAELFGILAEKRCRVIATFPQYQASNGISGEGIADLAREWFHVDVHATSNGFSTLGGNGHKRSARRQSQELVLTLSPR
jgi:adenine-specific DNA-methyltransferase